MAKKNKNDDSAAGCLGIILIVIAIRLVPIAARLVPIVIPPASAVCALLIFILYRRSDRPHVLAKFELSNQEKRTLVDSSKNYFSASDKMKNLKQVIKDEGLKHTKSGRLDQRTTRGVEVQGAMDNARQMIEEKRPTVEHLLGLPMERYKEARKHFAHYLGGFIAFVIWGCLILSQPRTEMLDYHTYQTTEAVSRVTNVFKSRNKVDKTPDAELNTDIKTDENNNDRQQEEKPVPVKPDITVWKAFFVWAIAYLMVFVIAIVYFSRKNRKPKSLA